MRAPSPTARDFVFRDPRFGRISTSLAGGHERSRDWQQFYARSAQSSNISLIASSTCSGGSRGCDSSRAATSRGSR